MSQQTQLSRKIATRTKGDSTRNNHSVCMTQLRLPRVVNSEVVNGMASRRGVKNVLELNA